MRPDTRHETLRLHLLPKDTEHLLLQVHGDHHAIVAHPPGKLAGEKSRPAPEIKDTAARDGRIVQQGDQAGTKTVSTGYQGARPGRQGRPHGGEGAGLLRVGSTGQVQSDHKENVGNPMA